MVIPEEGRSSLKESCKQFRSHDSCIRAVYFELILKKIQPTMENVQSLLLQQPVLFQLVFTYGPVTVRH